MVASYRIGMFFRPAAALCYGHVTIACSDNGYEGKHCVGLLCCFCLTAASTSPSFNKSACRRSRNRACSLLIVKFIDVRCFAQWNCTPKAGSLEFNNDLNTRIFVGKCGSQKPGREQAIAGSSSIASGVWVAPTRRRITACWPVTWEGLNCKSCCWVDAWQRIFAGIGHVLVAET
jgi:hypothetical protein